MSGQYLVRGPYGGLVAGCRTCKMPLPQHTKWCAPAPVRPTGREAACFSCGFHVCACLANKVARAARDLAQAIMDAENRRFTCTDCEIITIAPRGERYPSGWRILDGNWLCERCFWMETHDDDAAFGLPGSAGFSNTCTSTNITMRWRRP